jgi:tetratricopeptide (TPR) repeat protein
MPISGDAARRDLIATLESLAATAARHQSAGEFDKAEETYRTIVRMAPGWVEAQSNLGTVLHEQGKLEEAAERYEHALALRPDFPEILYNLANVRKAQGRLEEAVARYEEALVLRPDYADVHNNLGVALQQLRRIDQAIVHYWRALELKPDYPEALNNLGAALLEQGKFNQALELCQKALALRPDDPEAHNNLGIVLQHQKKLDEAARHFERALELKSDYAKAHNNLGTLLKEKGQFAKALAHYDQALAQNPDFAEAHYNRAELITFRSGDANLRALEALAQGGVPESKRLHIHFALAKAFDDIGDYARAMQHMLAGNALKRQEIDYDEAGTRRLFQSIREAFDAGLFHRLRGAGDPSPVPIFVLGMPRSGSTLIEQILASHPLVLGAGEMDNLTIVANGGAVPYPAFAASLDAGEARRMGQAYLAGLPDLPPGKSRITDKTPLNFLYVGLIRLILPNARIIHTVRDPVDTCISCFSKLFTFEMKFTYDLAELGRYYRCYSELMAHWRSLLPPDAMLDVRYEDVVNNLEQQARRLLDYVGLPWDDRCLSFHKTTRPVTTASAFQVRQPLFRSSLGRGRHYEAHLQPLLAELPV